MIAIHPEATDDPQTLRWVTPPQVLGFVGQVTGAPEPFDELLAGPVIAAVVEPGAVRTTLRDGEVWRSWGAPVRDALAAALERPGEWRSSTSGDPDEVLRAAVQYVLDGEVGDYVRSHGGSIEIVSAANEDVELMLRGTCAGCPAAGVTLHERIETEVRRIHPQLRSMHAQDDHDSRKPRWFSIGRRPGA